MQKSSCRIFTSLIALSFSWSLVLSGGDSLAAGQQNQEKAPLSLTQIESLLQGRVQGEGALLTNRTLDTAIAGEIQQRGVAFRADENTLEHLRKLGAGVKTLRALRLAGQGEKPLDAAAMSGKIVILVADFKSLNDQNYGVTEILLQQLRDATKDYTDVEVRALNSPITAQQGSLQALVKGKEQRASIVLWGWYTVTKEKLLIDVHCQFLKKPKNLVLLKEGQTFVLPISQLESFDFQMRLAGEMTYLTLLTVGLARLEAEDYDAAIARFTAALNQPTVPESMINPADVYYFRGVAAFLKRFSASKAATDFGTSDFDKAIHTDPRKAQAQLFRGIVLVLNEQYDQAILDFSHVIERESENGLAYLLRVLAYKQKGEERLAAADLIRAMRILGNTAEDPGASQVLRAYGYFLNRDFDKAISELDQLLRFESENTINLLMFRAIINGVKQNYDAALIDLNRAITLNSSVPFVYALRGGVYSEKGDHDKAIADFSHAIKLNPGNPDLHIWRGDAFTSKGAAAEALEDYDVAIKLSPAYVAAYSARARAFEKLGDHVHAVADYSEIIKLQPDSIVAYEDRARFYEEREDFARAIADYDEMIKRRPTEADYFFSRGFLYKRKGEIVRAIEDYSKAIELSPGVAVVYTFRASAYDTKGEFAFAIQDYTKAIELDSSNADTYVSRARVFQSRGLLDQAIADYDRAVKLEPNSKFVSSSRTLASGEFNQRGLEAERKGDIVGALRNFDLAIKLNPASALSYAFRASAHHDNGQVDLAFQDYDKAIALEPKKASLFTMRAAGYEKQNEWALAIKDYDAAIKLIPNEPDFYLKRAAVHDRIGLIDQAVADYEQALRIEPSSVFARTGRELAGLEHLSKGRLLDDKGNLDQAMKEYDTSIKFRPNAAEAYLARGMIFAEKNDNQRAIADLKKVIQIATDVSLRKRAEELLRQLESKAASN